MLLLIGFISQTFFAICMVPQIAAIFIRKTTKGVSAGMWVFQALGFVFSFWYGYGIHSWPLIVGNIWGLLCTVAFTIGFLKYKDK